MGGALIDINQDPELFLLVTGLFLLFLGFSGWAVMVVATRDYLHQVKGRAPGSSDQLHRSGERKHGRSAPLDPHQEENA